MEKGYSTNYMGEYRNTPKGRAKMLIANYVRNDRNNGFGNVIDFDSEWMVENIMNKSCAHCGKTGWKIIGCNRLDNSKGHTKDNVEPCCRECNISQGATEYNSKLVSQYTLDGVLVDKYYSAMDAERKTGFNHSHIIECCNGKIKTYKKYKWVYGLE